MKSARSWIKQQSIMFSILSWIRKRCQLHCHRTSPDIVSSCCHESITKQLEGLRKELAIVRFEVQFNEVIVDMWDKDWAMALRSSSLMF